MEANVCNMNQLDSDVLLPPRKRLLAGLKKLTLDSSSRQISPPPTLNDIDTHHNKKFSSHLNNPNLSPEEIVESSKSAAIAAAKVAKAARAAAEEKAVIAAKAVAAAKSALELVASVSEETSNDRHSRRNKLKKHIPVQLLYKKQPFGNYKTDEELARKLHQAMNSSPRISKNSSSSDWKNHKLKKAKLSPSVEKARISNGGILLEGNSHTKCNVNAESAEVNSEGCSPEVYTINVDGKSSKFCKVNQLEMGSGEAGPSRSREKSREAVDDTSPSGRKRGTIKLKKLSLSICTFRDQASPKELNRSSAVTEDIRGKSTAGNMSLFPVDLSTDEVMSAEAAVAITGS